MPLTSSMRNPGLLILAPFVALGTAALFERCAPSCAPAREEKTLEERQVHEQLETKEASSARAQAAAEVVTRAEATRTVVSAGPVKVTTTRRRAPAAPASPSCPPCPAVEEEVVVEERGPTTTTTEASGSSTTASSTSSSASTESSSSTASRDELSRKVTTVIIRERPRWLVGIGAGLRPLEPAAPPVLDAQVMYRLAGPLWLGVGVEVEAESFKHLTRLHGESTRVRLQAAFTR